MTVSNLLKVMENQENLPRPDWMSAREADEYRRYKEGRTRMARHPIAPVTSAKFFELYLTGKSCEDIHRLNPGFDLGQVVDAAVEGRWEDRRREHLDRLMDKARERVLQVQCESVEFVSDLLSAAHRLHGDKLKRFLQTGDPKELGDLQVGSLEQYRKAADVLLKLTGQDKQRVGGEVLHRHVLEPARRVLSREEQSKLLSELAGETEDG